MVYRKQRFLEAAVELTLISACKQKEGCEDKQESTSPMGAG